MIPHEARELDRRMFEAFKPYGKSPAEALCNLCLAVKEQETKIVKETTDV